MQQRGFATLAATALFLVVPACRSLVEADIEYVPCFGVDGDPYLEEFEGDDFQIIAERCWKADRLLNDTLVDLDDHDLVIRPNGHAAWTATEAAPFVSLRFDGDFALLTRAELATGLVSDHCANPGDAAGIALRGVTDAGVADGSWATFLVRPQLEEGATAEDCQDGVVLPAIIEAKSHGLVSPDASEMDDNKGEDAEVDIGLCRVADQLGYYYRDLNLDPMRENPWVLFYQQAIGPGPVDVGLTTTAEDTTTAPEGHFVWAAYYRELRADGCNFAEFEPPADDPPEEAP
jgi:hypothetical protein